jgi:hypothetical protein
MNAPENKLIDLQQQIQSTLELVQRKQGEIRRPADAARADHPALGDVAMPSVTSPLPPPRLDDLAERDLQIARELLHLQRTLSRQTFRGAESARRLVRRLVRKAEQNAQEIALLKGMRPGMAEGSTGESARLQLLLDEIAHNLADLEKLGRTLALSPSSGDARASSHPSDRR